MPEITANDRDLLIGLLSRIRDDAEDIVTPSKRGAEDNAAEIEEAAVAALNILSGIK